MSNPVQGILQTADDFFAKGEFREASRKYLEVLRIQSDHPVALHHLGLCCYRTGSHEQARNLIFQSVSIQQNNAVAHDHLGVVLVALNDFIHAEASFKSAIAIQPSYVDAYHNLGALLIKQKHYSRALAILESSPSTPKGALSRHKLLGQTHLLLGNTDQALTHLEQALMQRSSDPDVLSDIATALEKQSRHSEALKFHSLAIGRRPGENRHWQLFCDCLKILTASTPSSAGVEIRLQHLIRSETLPMQDLVQTVIVAAEHDTQIAEVLSRWAKPDAVGISDPWSDMITLAKCTSLMMLMSATPIDNIALERILTRCRREMLTSDTSRDDEILPLAISLALQCFNNEYAYVVSEAEKQAISQLENKLAKIIADGATPNPVELTILAAYSPLSHYAWANILTAQNWPSSLPPVIERQIKEPLEENEIRPTIGQLTKISDGVSSSVRDMYEQNPYPRWINAAVRRYDLSIADVLTSPPILLELGDYVAPDAPEILVAGCGTGQHSIQPATRYKASKVTAVDLSLASLAYAKRQSAKLNIDNISFFQADILQLDEIEKQFDVVECVGVLHHLENPFLGWETLVRRVKPGGLMKIGLYSEAARQDVLAGRKIVAEQNFEPTADGIRTCRQYIINAAAKGDPVLAQLCRRSDFHSLSACRDLIFHIQEHRFTLPEIKEYLKTLNLEFLDFEMNFAGQLGNFRKELNGFSAEKRLDKWHAYELDNPDTFRAMYQFWCRKPAQ